MGIEPTIRGERITGFEDREGHQTPFASIWARSPEQPLGTPLGSRLRLLRRSLLVLRHVRLGEFEHERVVGLELHAV